MEKYNLKGLDFVIPSKSKNNNNNREREQFRQPVTSASRKRTIYGYRSADLDQSAAEPHQKSKRKRKKKNKNKEKNQNRNFESGCPGPAASTDYSSGQAFVSAGILQPIPMNEEKDEGSNKCDTGDPTSVSDDEIQIVCSKGNPVINSSSLPASNNIGLKLDPGIKKQSAEVGSGSAPKEFETYGIGAKLLANMGFQPGKGLGKDLQGINAPIEASQLRIHKGRGAIGAYGPERSTATVPPALATEAKDEKKPDRVSQNREKGAKPKWQKANNHKVEYGHSSSSTSKYEYHTAGQVLEQQRKPKFQPRDLGHSSKVKVVDLTGPEKRVFRGYSAIFGQKKMLDEWAKDGNRRKQLKNGAQPQALGSVFDTPNLIDNIERLKDNSQQDIFENDRKAKAAADRIAILTEEMKRLTKIVEDKKKESVTSIPVIKEALKSWYPLDDPVMPVQLRNDWASLIGTPSESAELYDRVFWECWMPSVRQAANTEWNVINPQPMVRLIEYWKTRLPPSLLEIVYNQLIISKLTESVETWVPSLTLNVPIDSWIHPWLPYLKTRLEILYPTVRTKLSKAFVSWHPSDTSAKRVVTPWVPVFSKNVMDTFLLKNIIPKLQQAMQELIITSPGNQNLNPWKWVMEWIDMVPVKIIVNLLETMFFPKWLQFLATWLNQIPSYADVHKWYLYWRGVFDEHLKDDPIVLDNLRMGLQMIGDSLQSPGERVDFSKYFNTTQARPQKPPEPAAVAAVNHATPEMMADAIRMTSHVPHGFKELVQMKCEELGIVFMPIVNRYNEGRQVYKCGSVSIYINANVIFVQREGRSFHPMSLNRLICTASS